MNQCTQTPPCGRSRHPLEGQNSETIGQRKIEHNHGLRYVDSSPAISRGSYREYPNRAISLHPPHSLDYLYSKGGTPGTATPDGIIANNCSTTMLLSPGYLPTPCHFHQSIKGVSEMALMVPMSHEWGEESVQKVCQGNSWKRLHMSRAKLKTMATTSEVLSGFALVAMVELQINEPTNVPEWLLVLFAVSTTVLVAVHVLALMISTYLLPNIDAVSKMETHKGQTSSTALTDSPHDRMKGIIELAWAFSTVLGLFLFLVEIAIICWVKFWDYSFAAATAATFIVIPVLLVFLVFAIHFYHSLVAHKCETAHHDLEELENMKRDLDTITVNMPDSV